MYVYSGVFRCIPVYSGVFRCIPVYSGIFWCIPVFSRTRGADKGGGGNVVLVRGQHEGKGSVLPGRIPHL